jgi:hypothetical protein
MSLSFVDRHCVTQEYGSPRCDSVFPVTNRPSLSEAARLVELVSVRLRSDWSKVFDTSKYSLSKVLGTRRVKRVRVGDYGEFTLVLSSSL